MKPAIDQTIEWLESELAYYPKSAQTTMDKGYRVLEQSRKQALKIKERCRDEAMQALISRVCVSDGGIQVVEADNGHDTDATDTLIPSIGTIKTDPR